MPKLPFLFAIIALFFRCLDAHSPLSTEAIDTSQKNKIIPLEILFGNPNKIATSISPDGNYISYIAPDENDVLNVFIQDRSLDQPAMQITHDRYRGIRSYFWKKNAKGIFFIQDNHGDEKWHLFYTDIETGQTKDLLEGEPGYFGSVVYYHFSHPNKMLITLNSRDPSWWDVYAIDLETGSLTLEVENSLHAAYFIANHDGQVKAAVVPYQKEGSKLYLYDDQTWKPLLTWDNQDQNNVIAFTKNNDGFYILSNVGRDKISLIEYSIKENQSTTLFEDKDYDISTVIFDRNSHEILGVGTDKEKFEWIWLDPEMSLSLKKIQALLGENVSHHQSDEKGLFSILSVSSDCDRGTYYLFDHTAEKITPLFSVQPALDSYTFCPMKPISFTASDGMQLYGYLTLPNTDQKPLPTIILVHGGPWSRDYFTFHSIVQFLANRGYAVLQVNYRGSTGYGKAYEKAAIHEWGRAMQQDLIDGKNWLISQGYADPDKVAIMGGSYGGYATLAALAFTPDLFCCGIDIVGPSNLLTLLESIPPDWSAIVEKFYQAIGHPSFEKELLIERSPLFKAHQISKPLLIAQGANDPRVKQRESDQIVEAMRQHHLPVEYMLFPDEGHGFARPQNRLAFFRQVETFLEKHLCG